MLFWCSVPGEYFCALDANGRRCDLDQRPELSKGSVEFVAPTEYMVRPPMPPSYFFVIDVSVSAVRSGLLEVFTYFFDAALSNLCSSFHFWWVTKSPQPVCSLGLVIPSSSSWSFSILMFNLTVTMQVVAKTIKSCLDDLPGFPRTQIGFLTFDSTLHFYSLKARVFLLSEY